LLLPKNIFCVIEKIKNENGELTNESKKQKNIYELNINENDTKTENNKENNSNLEKKSLKN
jgi:hypothetical protein